MSGLLYYYGVVEQTDLYQMVTAGLPVQLTEDELIASLDETVLTDDGTYYCKRGKLLLLDGRG